MHQIVARFTALTGSPRLSLAPHVSAGWSDVRYHGTHGKVRHTMQPTTTSLTAPRQASSTSTTSRSSAAPLRACSRGYPAACTAVRGPSVLPARFPTRRTVSILDLRLQLPWSAAGFCRLAVSSVHVTLHVPGDVTVLPAPRHGRPWRNRALHAVDALLWGYQPGARTLGATPPHVATCRSTQQRCRTTNARPLPSAWWSACSVRCTPEDCYAPHA